MKNTQKVVAEIAAERQRQIDIGWSREHDSQHPIEHLTGLAAKRLSHWGETPTDEFVRGELVEAAALIVATIEWIDR